MINTGRQPALCTPNFHDSRREAARNWLALGLLLAAWNAGDNDAAARTARRPECLRAYPCVSVRAANRIMQGEE
ncbi:MAG TPA: hypothetical protein VGI65_19340 [Steroidobacteraceae bacterium]|jgi:hypothetical protein